MTRRALGRGLEALIPTRPADAAATVAEAESAAPPRSVAIERIRPNRYQPRRQFDAEKLQELADSIRENGILQPLLVTPRGDGFELVAGERRLRAARLAGLTEVPVVVRDVVDAESLKLAILENVQREDLNPMEEAAGYRRLIDEFGMTQQELAERIGKSRSSVANAIRLLNLSPEVQDRVRAGDLTPGHARALLGAATLEEQAELAGLVRERGLSVRQTEVMTQERRPRRKTGAAATIDPALRELERRLETRLGTRVRILSRKPDGSAGRIEIEYYAAADLERIFEIAGVPYLL